MSGADSGLGWLNDRQRDGGIDRVRLPQVVPGSLWLCGKQAVATRFDGGHWDVIVCLVERHELDGRYPDYLTWLDAAGDRALWRPIPDLHVPSLDEMRVLVDAIVGHLGDGQRVLIHCAAGKGRTGTTAACVLQALGFEVDDALAHIAASRPGAGPEVGAQRDLVAAYRP